MNFIGENLNSQKTTNKTCRQFCLFNTVAFQDFIGSLNTVYGVYRVVSNKTYLEKPNKRHF